MAGSRVYSTAEALRRALEERLKRASLTKQIDVNDLRRQVAFTGYPLLSDETCWFLAADFDKKTWEYDSQAFLETCQGTECARCPGAFSFREVRPHLDLL
jgi:hypothetical protein